MQEPIQFKTFQSPQKWFEFQYPSYWESMVVEGIPAFFDASLGGVLQVYSFENKKQLADSESEMKNYLAIHGVEFNEDLVARFKNSQGTDIISCEFMKEDRHWCLYVLANGYRLYLATFNTDGKISDALYAQLSQIISSVKFL
ncbi:MAG: hypothetical protein JJT78_15915 [Leptospira sp.]|nr:hypothetical protein [Leptospira sp.]